ncbi:IclR family transcriptional regulator [Nocardioides sp.]|uniref:IclR family transcriptional regulator n=1 Tax=Nocardioides sp. TaxID=35761 RepID=UPI0039E3DA7A
MRESRGTGGVQSVHRALDLIEAVAEHAGQLSIAEIAAFTDLPAPTVHRLMQTLVDRGYMQQTANRQYALGVRLVPLGAAAGRRMADHAVTVLADLVDAIGESANLAVLSGDHAEYVAQAPSKHSMRMFTEVGRRVELHCTGVGKAMLAQLAPDQVRTIARRVGLPGYTPHTLTTETALLADLGLIRERGYALDEQEQELGVRCVAVAVPHPSFSWSAVSVSGPLPRMTDDLIAEAVPQLQEAARHLSAITEGTP